MSKRNPRIRPIFILMLSIIVIMCGIGVRSVDASAQKVNPPAFSGNATVVINGNIPTFTDKEKTTVSFEKYGALDKLGRCTAAIACIGTDIMPEEERGSIGSVKPTGWNQNKYPGIVDSQPPYLYNRCHLIGYQLTGENANEKNLITGTRYMNVEGMLPYENEVANYVLSTGNHVMYRVTPIFEGSNLLCSGVQMEAYSVEDNGKGVSFNIYCYNVQPGVDIDYTDGSNKKTEEFVVAYKENQDSTVAERNIETQDNKSDDADYDYVANKNTKKFHYPSCSSVDDMKEKNKLYYSGTRDELIDKGYKPCKRCNP